MTPRETMYHPELWHLTCQYDALMSEMMTIGDYVRSQQSVARVAVVKGYMDHATDMDVHADRHMVSTVRHVFPQDGVLTEESGRVFDPASEYLWHIDPIDGTTNFEYGFPDWYVSLARTHTSGRVLFSACYNPPSQSMMWSQEGHGTYIGQKRQQVNQTVDSLGTKAAIHMHIPGYEPKPGMDPRLHRLRTDHAQSVYSSLYRTGTKVQIALNDVTYAAKVASGMLTAQIVMPGTGAKLHDVLPGVGLVVHAGGRATDIYGEPFHPDNYSKSGLILSNGIIHDQLLELTIPSLTR